MSRAAPAAGSLACLLATLALLGAVPTGEARAAAGDCAWTKHSKRVVKKVRRQGEVRRVKRTRHWWTCVPVATAPAPVPPLAIPAPPPADPEPDPDPEEGPPTLSYLGVKAQEWKYTLSRPAVPAGEVVVELNNMGEDPHNLNLRLEGSKAAPFQIPVTPSLEQASERFTLPAGDYRLWCDLDEHDLRGMNASLEVSAG